VRPLPGAASRPVGSRARAAPVVLEIVCTNDLKWEVTQA